MLNKHHGWGSTMVEAKKKKKVTLIKNAVHFIFSSNRLRK